MKFEISDFYFQNQYCGLKVENEKILIFFGNKNFEPHYKQIFPQYEFSFLKQTHGNNLVKSNGPYQKNIEADAQWTALSNLALVIQTADCLPTIITDIKMEKVAALHAGWRGVENRIAPNVLNQIFPNELVNVFTGPHILKQSFEVDLEVKDLLLKCTKPKNEEFEYNKVLNKYFVNLKTISKLQIEESHKMKFYYHANIDTKTDLNFCSFRRDGKNAGRNLSFVVKK